MGFCADRSDIGGGSGFWCDGQYGSYGKGFSFALIGDVPYSDEQIEKLDNVIYDVNRRHIAWVLLAGDIKGGSVLRSDEVFQDRLTQYSKFRPPFGYTPGDNEWTDCHRTGAGQFDPLERVDKLLRSKTADGRFMRLENFTRVETFGTDDVHWVKVTVNPYSTNVFSFEPVIVDENRFER